ncbi:CPCC family cysteine-rich protein [Priestia aryabhattai]
MYKYTCPCCGYKTLEEEPPDTFDICEICFWEDDGVQYKDPDYERGANVISLREAQQNFVKYGACDEESVKFTRRPNKFDIRDLEWKPF